MLMVMLMVHAPSMMKRSKPLTSLLLNMMRHRRNSKQVMRPGLLLP